MEYVCKQCCHCHGSGRDSSSVLTCDSTVPFLFIGFGFISLCTAFVKDFAGLMVARAVLGGFEGGVIPLVPSSVRSDLT